MLFHQFIGIDTNTINPLVARHTVKGILIDGDKILLLQSNRGDCTFPGGGIEQSESHQVALAREILEETGYTCTSIGCKVGQIDLRRADIFDNSKMYELISHYYTFKTTTTTRQELQLTEGELNFELKPVWIEIEEAIRMNNKYRDTGTTVDFWIQQEIYVLELIRDNIKVDFGEGGVYR